MSKTKQSDIEVAAAQGMKAFINNNSLNTNPYLRDSNYKLWESWCNGWLDAKLEQNKIGESKN